MKNEKSRAKPQRAPRKRRSEAVEVPSFGVLESGWMAAEQALRHAPRRTRSDRDRLLFFMGAYITIRYARETVRLKASRLLLKGVLLSLANEVNEVLDPQAPRLKIRFPKRMRMPEFLKSAPRVH